MTAKRKTIDRVYALAVFACDLYQRGIISKKQYRSHIDRLNKIVEEL